MSAYSNINVRGYIEIYDIISPENTENGQGRLYKKTGSDSIFWKPDSSGLEVDLSSGSFNQELNTTDNVEFKELSIDSVGFNSTNWKVEGDVEFKITNGLTKPFSISNQVINTEKDNTRISLGDNISIQNSDQGSLDFNRYNGTLDNQTDVTTANDIGGINFNGLVNGTYQTGAYISCRTNDNWVDGSGKGAIINFASTISNQNIPLIKMSINGQGVYINSGNNSFLLPQNNGAIGRVMTMSNNSIAKWIEPFSSDQPTDIGTTPQFNEVNYPNWKTSIDAGNRFEFLYNQNTAKLNIEPSGNLVSFGQEDCVNYLKMFRGTIGAESPSSVGDRVGFCFDGQTPSGSRTIGCIISNPLQTFSNTNQRSDMTFSITALNQTTPDIYLRIRDDGLTIGATNSYTLPITRGLEGQVLQTNNVGVLSWYTPFVPSFGYFQSKIESVVYTDIVPELISNTQITIEKTGLHHAIFSSQVALRGTLSQQLVANLVKITNKIDALSYTNRVAPFANETITAGNYYINSASSISGSLTFSGSSTDIFVIYINGAMTLGTNVSIILSNGTRAENVFILSVGGLTMGNNCTLQGTWIGKGAMTFSVDTTIVKGRILSNSGNITLNNNSTITTLTDDTSDFITIGVLVDTMIFNIVGNITQNGTPSIIGDVKTDSGTISNFDEYDGTFKSNPSNTVVLVSFTFYKNGIELEDSKRFLEGQYREHDNISLCCIHQFSLGDILSVYIQVINDNTSSAIGTRCLTCTLVK